MGNTTSAGDGSFTNHEGMYSAFAERFSSHPSCVACGARIQTRTLCMACGHRIEPRELLPEGPIKPRDRSIRKIRQPELSFTPVPRTISWSPDGCFPLTDELWAVVMVQSTNSSRARAACSCTMLYDTACTGVANGSLAIYALPGSEKVVLTLLDMPILMPVHVTTARTTQLTITRQDRQ